MPAHTMVYRLTELTDRTYTPNALRSAGDVEGAAQADCEKTLRIEALFPAGSITAGAQFHYEPAPTGGDPQDRLSVYLVGAAARAEEARTLDALLSCGPLNRLHHLEPVDELPARREGLDVSCDIVRRQALLKPTVCRDRNPNALPAYYRVLQLQPLKDNDYLLLVSVLHPLSEPVVIELYLEPAGMAPELSAYMHYGFRLQEINQGFRRRGEFPGGPLGDLDDLTQHGRLRRIEPFEVEEPLVEELLREQRSESRTLHEPHLRFHARVWASTEATARLIAGVVAECGLEEASYDLFVSRRGDPFFTEPASGRGEVRVVPMPTLKRLLDGQDIPLYQKMEGIANLAPVDQLTGIFRLPLASYASPCCIRKDSDPPREDPSGMILFGREERDYGHRSARAS